jgi:hypothetical protein
MILNDTCLQRVLASPHRVVVLLVGKPSGVTGFA